MREIRRREVRIFDRLEQSFLSANAIMLLSPQIRSVRCRLLLAIVAPALLSGCQGIQSGASSSAQLRVIDASPDAGSVDGYQNNAGLAYNLGFGMVTTYVPMQPGNYTLSAVKAGTRQTLATGAVSLAAGHQYTSVVGNIAAAMQQTLYVDQTQPAPAGQVSVRLIQQITRGGAVDVYLVPGSGKLAFTAPLITNLSFGGNSGYVTFPAGTYAVVVAPAGSSPTSSAGTLLSGAQVSYASGAVRTIVLIDSALAARPFAEVAPPLSSGVLTPAVEALIAVDADAQ
jgi:hypothetical protein